MTLDYKKAGVDIDAGNEAVRRIKAFAPEIGSFSGLFPLPKGYEDPMLVSGTDGVGTKLKIAFALDKHDTIGIDLVAMSVNDILCCGAKPLFFLDYIGCQKVIPEQIALIVKGIAEGCKQSDCALVGGETAELSDMYTVGEYDLAGFAVGIVDKKKVIDGKRIKPGDKIVGLRSSGLHSNGYTLARKALGEEDFADMLIPTKIYVKEVRELLGRGVDIKGLAHITGGGLVENIPRVFPAGVGMKLDYKSWIVPDIFKKIQKNGNIAEAEMYRVFNMGIGMVLVLADAEVKKLKDPLIIGEIIKENA
ncbi:MAG: phosphoribosylformylglycinamidine cyclo-ligase [Candidatus Margulisiibacteriota bacterium]|jgi:phosphoribosylformylglycinamidine cyclo-ligase